MEEDGYMLVDTSGKTRRRMDDSIPAKDRF